MPNGERNCPVNSNDLSYGVYTSEWKHAKICNDIIVNIYLHVH